MALRSVFSTALLATALCVTPVGALAPAQGTPADAAVLGLGQGPVDAALRFLSPYAQQKVGPQSALGQALSRVLQKVQQQGPAAAIVVDMGSAALVNDSEDGHLSAGEDIDLGFYLLGAEGQSLGGRSWVALGPDGRCAREPSVRFDDGRNWLLVQALLTEPSLQIERIYVSSTVRSRLLREAERRGIEQALRLRAAQLLFSPLRWNASDRFHVRLSVGQPQAPTAEVASQARKSAAENMRPESLEGSSQGRPRAGTRTGHGSRLTSSAALRAGVSVQD